MNQDAGMIHIRGARLHNLKSVDVDIPLGKISAICGPSGCGKSTLALDVLHAECRRRYLETLSPFVARVAGVRGPAPVDSIEGLRPSLALESGSVHHDSRATVGSITECETLLRSIWARKASVHCPHCKRTLDILNSQTMVERIASLEQGSRVQLLAPTQVQGRSLAKLAEESIAQGFVRGWTDSQAIELSNIPQSQAAFVPQEFAVVVDRIVVKEGMRSRIADSVQIALRVGQECLWVQIGDNKNPLFFSLLPRCPEHGLLLPEFEAGLFSPHSTAGRCPTCEGTGLQGAKTCSGCNGDRLNSILLDSSLLNLNAQEITWREILHKPVEGLDALLEPLFNDLPPVLQKPAEQARERLQAMQQLGLEHLALGRGVDSISDGEWQRLRLVGLAGGHLNGLLFVLDEPSSGLHPVDAIKVWTLLEKIRARDNTLLLIEHQPEFLRRSEYLIEMGPGAGELGGEILRQGPREQILACDESPTRTWLAELDSPTRAYTLEGEAELVTSKFISIQVAPFRNLKSMQLKFPMGAFTVVCGISGSGKSTLVLDGIAAKLRDKINAPWCTIKGAEKIEAVVEAGSEGLRASARSTVATATGLMTPLRDLFASLTEAKARGFGPGHFSLNTKGGRCEACLGLGVIQDHYGDYPCHVCQGKRFRDEVLGVRFKTMNISEIMDLTIHKALHLFAAFPAFKQRLTPVRETGLSYLLLGQSTTHLSGGELQRLGLAIELSKTSMRPTLHVFDEPARGLHREDIAHLLTLFHQLCAQGHTIVAIEHQPTFLHAADWLIELGPEAGERGGDLLYCGPLGKVKGDPNSRIAPYM